MKSNLDSYKKGGKIFLIWFLIFLGFALGSFFLICYTSGYAINWRTFKIVKTSIIYVASQPRDVDIYLDGKLKKLRSPARFSFLLPGVYNVSIKKDGFIPWEKSFATESGMVSKDDNIILFREKPDSVNFETDVVTNYKLAPDRKTVTFANSTGIWVLNLESREKWQLWPKSADQNINLIGFSDNSQKLLMGINDDYLVLSLSSKRSVQESDIFRLSSIIAVKFSTISWRPGDNQKLYGLAGGIFYSIDTLNLSLKIIDRGVLTFSASPDTIFYFKQVDGNQELWSANLEGNSTNKILGKITNIPANLFVSYDNQLVFIDSNQDLFFFDDNKTKLSLFGQGITDVFWGRDEGGFFNFFSNSRLLFTTQNEIWWWSNEEKTPPQLVTRLSNQVDKAALYPDQSHIVYLSNNKISIMEEDGKNIVTVGETKIPEFNLLSRGTRMLLADPAGLMELKIR